MFISLSDLFRLAFEVVPSPDRRPPGGLPFTLAVRFSVLCCRGVALILRSDGFSIDLTGGISSISSIVFLSVVGE